jgi:hypothetical protein
LKLAQHCHPPSKAPEAEQKLASLGAARALLAGEAEQARAKLANAEGAVSAAAVLSSAAEEIADAFDKAKAEADACLAGQENAQKAAPSWGG